MLSLLCWSMYLLLLVYGCYCTPPPPPPPKSIFFSKLPPFQMTREGESRPLPHNFHVKLEQQSDTHTTEI